ncbi:MAG: DUF456 domain-containing protein [Bacillota bacterium]|nr:DUF456 domain-containing protein [Bacillota bacterium]
MLEIIALVVASLLFLTGLLGTLLPILPGAPVIWLGMLIYGFIAGFENLGFYFMLGQAFLALVVMAVDYLFTALGSHYFGGSKAALWGAGIGLLIGLFFFPIGLLIGPFVGATLADLIFRRRTDQAVRSGIGATLGFVSALPIKLTLEAVMIIWFIVRIF